MCVSATTCMYVCFYGIIKRDDYKNSAQSNIPICMNNSSVFRLNILPTLFAFFKYTQIFILELEGLMALASVLYAEGVGFLLICRCFLFRYYICLFPSQGICLSCTLDSSIETENGSG